MRVNKSTYSPTTCFHKTGKSLTWKANKVPLGAWKKLRTKSLQEDENMTLKSNYSYKHDMINVYKGAKGKLSTRKQETWVRTHGWGGRRTENKNRLSRFKILKLEDSDYKTARLTMPKRIEAKLLIWEPETRTKWHCRFGREPNRNSGTENTETEVKSMKRKPINTVEEITSKTECGSTT